MSCPVYDLPSSEIMHIKKAEVRRLRDLAVAVAEYASESGWFVGCADEECERYSTVSWGERAFCDKHAPSSGVRDLTCAAVVRSLLALSGRMCGDLYHDLNSPCCAPPDDPRRGTVWK